jgi:hypothetical protein
VHRGKVQRSLVARVDDVIVRAILEQVPDDFFMLRIDGSMESGERSLDWEWMCTPLLIRTRTLSRYPRFAAALTEKFGKIVSI